MIDRLHFIIVISLLLTGCSKYEEGGLTRTAEKRLTPVQWTFSDYLLNGESAAGDVLISNLTETYEEGGAYVRSYMDLDGESFTEVGEWAFDDSMVELQITEVSSIPWSEEHSTLSSSRYHVVKLTKDAYWYRYENGGDLHEFHFVAP